MEGYKKMTRIITMFLCNIPNQIEIDLNYFKIIEGEFINGICQDVVGNFKYYNFQNGEVYIHFDDFEIVNLLFLKL